MHCLISSLNPSTPPILVSLPMYGIPKWFATCLSSSDTSLKKIHTSFTLSKNPLSEYEVRVFVNVSGEFHEIIPTDMFSLLDSSLLFCPR